MTDELLADLDLANGRQLSNEISQVRAKASLTRLLGEAPDVRWQYHAAWIAGSAAMMHAALQELAISHPGRVDDALPGALVTAQTWEGLAQLGESAARATAFLNAALGYELAGFQANAACLARAASPRSGWTTDPTEVGLLSAFVQRLFLRVRGLVGLFASEPDEALLDDEYVRRAGVAATALGLMEASNYFLNGRPQHVARAYEYLRQSERGLSEIGDAVGSVQARNIRAALPTMVARSTWANLAPLSEAPRWNRYLRALARGLTTPVIDGRSISELWPSQQAALDQGLLGTQANVTIRMPTSAGKTRIAEMAMVKTLVENPGSRCLYVAPFRALVSEVTESLSNLFTDLGFSSSSAIGALEDDLIEASSIAHDDLVVLTPEKLDLALRLQPDTLRDVKTVVLDEGHLVGDESRGIKYEFLVARLRRALPDARFILISAVVPDQTLEDFAEWMGGRDGSTVTSSWRPALLRVASLDWAQGRGILRFERLHPDAALEQFLPDIVQLRTFEFTNPLTRRLNTERFPKSKGEVAAETAFTLVPRGPVLIFTTQTDWAESIGRALEKRLMLTQASEEPLPPPLARATGAPDPLSSEIAAVEWLGSNHVVSRLLHWGVGVHHGKLPDAVRLAIETDFRARRLAVLVATTTLAQGVNLPVSTTIIHSVWRSDDHGNRTRISARDYWNIAGRTGRAGEETEGTLIHIVQNAIDRSDFEYFLRLRNDVEPVESALFSLLSRLTSERISRDELTSYLDAEILGLLLEESIREDPALLDEVIDQTLCAVQAARREVQTGPIKQGSRRIARDIVERVEDPARLRTYGATGLSSLSCEQLRTHAVDSRRTLGDLLESANLTSLETLTDVFLTAVEPLPEMQTTVAQPTDVRGLIDRWLRGTPVSTIASEFAELETESISRFIQEYAAYLLPWGITAFLRIATAELALTPSLTVRTFPSMMKWGVPTVEATWAHSSGVTSRQLAIVLGESFASHATDRGPGEFRTWLRTQDVDSLAADLGIEGRFVQETARAVVRSRKSESLDLLEAGTLFPLTVSVPVPAWVPAEALRREDDRPLSLQRDYMSGVNRNATFVALGDQFLGYIPWDLSTALGPEIDAGFAPRVEWDAVADQPTGPVIRVRIDHPG